MIHEVDDALRQLVESSLRNGSGVGVSFDAPSRDWAAKQSAPTVNAFLYDIREDLTRRSVQPRPIYQDDRIVGRGAPPRWFKLSYLITAWTQRPEDEHRLLSRLLALFVGLDVIPEEVIGDGASIAGHALRCEVGLASTGDRSTADVWSSLGGDFRPSVDLVVYAPLDPGASFETGPPVLEDPRVVLDGDVPTGGKRRKAPSAGPAVTPLEGAPGAEERRAGLDPRPGRTLHVRPSTRR